MKFLKGGEGGGVTFYPLCENVWSQHIHPHSSMFKKIPQTSKHITVIHIGCHQFLVITFRVDLLSFPWSQSITSITNDSSRFSHIHAYIYIIYLIIKKLKIKKIVLKRCVSGLPTDECPFIPKQYLQQLLLRRNARNLDTPFSSDSSMSPFSSPSLPSLPSSSSGTNAFDKIESLAQTAVQEPTVQCEERRQLGQQILIEKVQKVDSMLSRFVGNFLSHFTSNSTYSEEVNENFQSYLFFILYIIYVCFMGLSEGWTFFYLFFFRLMPLSLRDNKGVAKPYYPFIRTRYWAMPLRSMCTKI